MRIDKPLRAVDGPVRIPTEVGQRFRSNWTNYSGRSGPRLPEEVAQAFRGSGPAIRQMGTTCLLAPIVMSHL